MEEKTYKIFIEGRTIIDGKEVRGIEVQEWKESELEPNHLALFEGELLKAWNNCPPRIQIKFMQELIREIDGKFKIDLYKELNIVPKNGPYNSKMPIQGEVYKDDDINKYGI